MLVQDEDSCPRCGGSFGSEAVGLTVRDKLVCRRCERDYHWAKVERDAQKAKLEVSRQLMVETKKGRKRAGR